MIFNDKSTCLCLAFVFASRLFLQGFGYPGEGRAGAGGVELHLLLFIKRKYAFICVKRTLRVRRYIHYSEKTNICA